MLIDRTVPCDTETFVSICENREDVWPDLAEAEADRDVGEIQEGFMAKLRGMKKDLRRVKNLSNQVLLMEEGLLIRGQIPVKQAAFQIQMTHKRIVP